MRGPKINFKKELMNAGLGAVVGLTIKHGVGYVTKGNPQAAEATRRAANVAAAYAGKGTGELAFQVADAAINQLVVIPSGGTPAGSAPGEMA